MAGEGDDVVVLHGWPQTAWQSRHLATDITTIEIPEAGHWMAEDNLHRLAAEIVRFVLDPQLPPTSP